MISKLTAMIEESTINALSVCCLVATSGVLYLPIVFLYLSVNNFCDNKGVTCLVSVLEVLIQLSVVIIVVEDLVIEIFLFLCPIPRGFLV